MTNYNIIPAIKLLTGLTDTELAIVLKAFETKNIKRKTNILKAGKTAKEVYFIVSGGLTLPWR